MSAPPARVHAIVVTFRRPQALAATLALMSAQTRPPDTILVIDNDPVGSAAAAVAAHAQCRLLSPGQNLGPAGALALGVRLVLDEAGVSDRVVFVDDDDPPDRPEVLANLLRLLEESGEDVAGVGLAGGRWDRRLGRPTRVHDDQLRDLVEVDWLGGGQLPVYRTSALRRVPLDASLFFGYDDLDLGVSLREAGWRLAADGAAWLERRVRLGRTSLDRAALRARSSPSAWRTYYTNRNLIVLARRHAGPLAVASATTLGCGRATRALMRGRWSVARHAALGVAHGLLNRRGRLVEPSLAKTDNSDG